MQKILQDISLPLIIKNNVDEILYCNNAAKSRISKNSIANKNNRYSDDIVIDLVQYSKLWELPMSSTELDGDNASVFLMKSDYNDNLMEAIDLMLQNHIKRASKVEGSEVDINKDFMIDPSILKKKYSVREVVINKNSKQVEVNNSYGLKRGNSLDKLNLNDIVNHQFIRRLESNVPFKINYVKEINNSEDIETSFVRSSLLDSLIVLPFINSTERLFFFILRKKYHRSNLKIDYVE